MADEPNPTPEPVAPAPTPDDPLKELTGKSWNLELIISGAALFATLRLPDFLDQLLAYYQYDIQTDNGPLQGAIPVLMYGFSKIASYILFVAFLTNFVMRAVWVSLIGLLAAYPAGIRYDWLLLTSSYTRDRYARELGPLDQYIIRLDKRCNIVFSLAFQLVIVLVGIVLTYGLLIGLFSVLQWLLPTSVYRRYEDTLLIGFFGILGLVGLANALCRLPFLQKHPRWGPLTDQIQKINEWYFQPIYRPLLYIRLTFYSNARSEKILRQQIAIFLVVFGGLTVLMTPLLLGKKRSFLPSQMGYTIRANAYDDQRTDGEPIAQASIPTAVVHTTLVPIFVAFPKKIDVLVNRRFQEPNWPDTLTTQALADRRAIWKLKVMEQYFQLSVNDSLYVRPGWLFAERASAKQTGLTAILLPTNLKTGINQLKISIPDTLVADGSPVFAQIPFWYLPKK